MMSYYLLGNYHTRTRIYSGCHTDVYEGTHVNLRRRVAIKVLDLERVRDVEERRRLDERFYEEACMLETARHSTVVEIFEYGEVDSVRYIVMEYAALGSLYELYPFGQRVPYALILSYARQIGWALQRLHYLGLIHRDIKPENIFLNANRQVLIGDFGLVVEERVLHRYRLYGGTRYYMAPEQEQGCPGFASDQYALATMVFEWLTGHAPFEGTPLEVTRLRNQYDAPSPRAFVPDLPVALERVLSRALSYSPQQRYERVLDFIEELEGAMQPLVTKRAAPVQARRGNVTRPALRAQTTLQHERVLDRRKAHREQLLAQYRGHNALASEPLHAARRAYPRVVVSQKSPRKVGASPLAACFVEVVDSSAVWP